MTAEPERDAFVRRYGGIYENSPWVAERSYDEARDIEDPEHLAEIFARCVDNADEDTRLALIRGHPDLADRAAIAGKLSAVSTEEQRSAGIDRCTREEYELFQSLNSHYKIKFGFPFVMAVRGSTPVQILACFQARLENNRETEFNAAIAEIHKIARLRLKLLAHA